MRKELQNIYDYRKSFYGKAETEETKNELKLYSYDTLVAEIKNGKLKVFDTYSATTLRHIKEFAIQNGFKAENKKEIEKLYMG